MKYALIAILTLISSPSFGATYCNAGGADGLLCKSAGGEYAIYVHDRYYWNDISTVGFCNSGYIKLRGVELNGKLDGQSPQADGLELSTSITSAHGLTVSIPGTEQTREVQTVIFMQFGDVAAKALNDTNLSWAKAVVDKNQKTGTLYMVNAQDKVSFVNLNCSDE